MKKLISLFAAFVMLGVLTRSASATANYVFHEQTNDFVATPTCPNGETDTLGGQYVETADRSASAGFQVFAPEAYTLRFKIEFQFFTNQTRVYYTTDGSTPSGARGTGSGTTQVVAADYTWTYADQNNSCAIVDVATAQIPPQPAGTVVKYIVAAFHSEGGDEIFANSGTCAESGCATVFQYESIAANLIVTNTADNGDGVCDAAGTGDGCTLREAIQTANTIAAGTAIGFAVGVSGTISLTEPLQDLIGDISIQGPGPDLLTIGRSAAAGTPDFRIFRISNFSTTGPIVTLSDLTIANGKASGTFPDNMGGAILNDHGNLLLQNCVFRQNSADGGGAIFNDGTAGGSVSATLLDCTFTQNTASTGLGGAFYNFGPNGGNATASLSNCTLSQNSAAQGGGAIFNDGFQGTVSLTLNDCTLSQNSTSGNGGGIFNSGSSGGNASLALTSCTFSQNSAGSGAGVFNDGSNFGTASFSIGNSILANSGGNIANNFGNITSSGFNLSSDDASAFLNQASDLNTTNPQLAPLANNGGLTATHALLPDSPAIDKGKSFGATTDQRGERRPIDQVGIPNAADGSDIGAFERAIFTPGALAFEAATYTVNESAGTGTITITITRSGGSDRTVAVNYATSDGTATAGSDYTAASGTLSFASGETSKSFSLAISDDSLAEGPETINLRLSNPTNGAALGVPATATLTIVDNDGQLTLSVRPLLFAENAGARAATGTVTRNGPTTAALTVNLSSGDTSEATVPASVVIPAGRASATFTIAAIDDAITDGPQKVAIIANAAGFAQGKTSVLVSDNEARLAISISPNIFAETAGARAATGTITRNTPTATALTLKLTSSNPRKVSLPTFVTIPVGAASATFPVGAIDNTITDGPVRIGISARVKGYTTVSTGVTVLDNEARLSLSVNRTSFSEGAGSAAATATVSRNTPNTAPLSVLLSSSDISEARVPNSVTIPAGASSITFPIAAIDDTIIDGPQTVTLRATASSTGYQPGATNVSVLDNEAATRRLAARQTALMLSTIRLSGGGIVLVFSGALNVSAADPARYAVTVDGARVEVQSAALDASRQSVTLGLADGAAASGAQVSVSYDLLDATGLSVSGQSGPSAAR